MRRAGLLLPLFSCATTRSWGIGEISDVATIAEWLGGAGQSVLQLLPLNEMAAGQQSPYSATSAMAIDPIFIDMSAVGEFAALGGEASLSGADREALARARAFGPIDYAAVRRLKQAALAAAFDRFYADDWCRDTDRARSMRAFVARQAWWIDDYALFVAIHDRESGQPWSEWPEALRTRVPEALECARRELAREILYREYLQWIADCQWRDARAAARRHGVAIFGDLPFMVDADSADVWLHSRDFHLDVSAGVPPDAFSATGQDWGMPVYNWDAVEASNFSWLRERARRGAELYDGYRVDHLVGFYRTYGRPRNGSPAFFSPSDEEAQTRLGEQVLDILRSAGPEIIAEDLGTVPDFVRSSLERLAVPGFRVFRWERLWHEEGQPFRDPVDYPPLSVATSGTHDTEPMAVWWDQLPPEDRQKVGEMPTIERFLGTPELAQRPFDDGLRDALLEALFASGSDLLLLPVQDVFGWRERINEPATVTPENWTFRLPWPADRLDHVPEARERRERLRAWSKQYARMTGA
jgi:4-alpha-glucanotransferase